VKVWDLDTGKLVLDIQQYHSTWILSAKADYKRIISTSQDNRALVLDFSTGTKDLGVLDNTTMSQENQALVLDSSTGVNDLGVLNR
jgi:hypothetical protein